MANKTASLTAGLVAKKGEASPALVQSQPIQVVPSFKDSSVAKTAANDYYKALTVKLDRERYEGIKNAGVKLDKKSQEIFVEALDLWLKAQTV